MKRRIALILTLCMLLPMLSACHAEQTGYEKYTMSFFGTFDTVIQVIGYAQNRDTFDSVAAEAQAQYEHLHRVFDGYNAYEGVLNLYYLNAEAPNGPVRVEPELLELLQYCKATQPTLLGTVNVALGSVLRLWHDVRETAENTPALAVLPSMEALLAAAEHVDFDDVIIDPDAGTVLFADPALRVDLGAIAKGYATELVAQWMLGSDMPSFILSAGGNVRVGDPPLDGRLRWGVSVQNPDEFATGIPSEKDLDALYLTNRSVVTSGDYQRFFFIGGKRYHHIISPDTLMPADYFRGVTIVCEDSGWADLLSTAVFLMPYDPGRAFVDQLDGVDALWILPDGAIEMTDGMAAMARSQGATSK